MSLALHTKVEGRSLRLTELLHCSSAFVQSRPPYSLTNPSTRLDFIKTGAMESAQTQTHPAWCVIYGVGIIFFLVLYGIFQEGIMTVPYDGALFQYSVFLVLCNRLAAVVFGLVMAVSKGEQLTNQAPLWKYLIVSLSNVYASTCQYEALKYVSFAVQMLGKSFKMMPVMIWGMIISGKSYGLRDWGVALAVTLGCTEFLMTGPTNSKVDSGNSM